MDSSKETKPLQVNRSFLIKLFQMNKKSIFNI